MGFESDPSLKYEADNEKLQKAFTKDAKEMANGNGDNVDNVDIHVPSTDKPEEVGDGFLQKVVTGKANEANDAVEAKDKEEASKKADDLLAKLDGEKDSTFDSGAASKSKLKSKKSVIESAPEGAATEDVAKDKIAKKQKKAAEMAGDLVREGRDEASES